MLATHMKVGFEVNKLLNANPFTPKSNLSDKEHLALN